MMQRCRAIYCNSVNIVHFSASQRLYKVQFSTKNVYSYQACIIRNMVTCPSIPLMFLFRYDWNAWSLPLGIGSCVHLFFTYMLSFVHHRNCVIYNTTFRNIFHNVKRMHFLVMKQLCFANASSLKQLNGLDTEKKKCTF